MLDGQAHPANLPASARLLSAAARRYAQGPVGPTDGRRRGWEIEGEYRSVGEWVDCRAWKLDGMVRGYVVAQDRNCWEIR